MLAKLPTSLASRKDNAPLFVTITYYIAIDCYLRSVA